MSRILLVDDEPQILRVLRTPLQASGHDVITVADGLQGLRQLQVEKPDLIITDLAMPVMNGLEFTKAVRELSNVPIIVLSVRNTEAMKVQALDHGADDYLTKPFSTPELLARVRAHLRRNPPADESGSRIEIGDFVIDTLVHSIAVRGEQVHLTPKEFELLLLFARSPGRVLTHKVLLRAIWGHGGDSQPEYLRVLVAALRKKLERGEGQKYIHSEPWVGYRFEPEVNVISPSF